MPTPKLAALFAKPPPTPDQLREMVGGYIEVIELRDGTQLVVDEDAKMKGKELNPDASALFAGLKPKNRAFTFLAGDAVHLSGDARIKWG